MNFKEINYLLESSSKITYPEITDIKKDYKLGQNMYDSFAGRHGELTAISQYIYEHITTEENKELSSVLLHIAIQEMHHLDMLGALLVNLGFVPYFMGKHNNKWCSDNVTYRYDGLEEMLKINIKSEETAIKEYKRLIEMTDDDKVKMILSRIIMDEEMHIKVFSGLLEICK